MVISEGQDETDVRQLCDRLAKASAEPISTPERRGADERGHRRGDRARQRDGGRGDPPGRRGDVPRQARRPGRASTSTGSASALDRHRRKREHVPVVGGRRLRSRRGLLGLDRLPRHRRATRSGTLRRRARLRRGRAPRPPLLGPSRSRPTYPYSADGAPMWTADMHWPDPWALIAAMAQITSRVRFTTNIYVAPARDLFTVAKAVSTAAALSRRSGVARPRGGLVLGRVRADRSGLPQPWQAARRDDRRAPTALHGRVGLVPRRALRLRPAQHPPGTDQTGTDHRRREQPRRHAARRRGSATAGSPPRAPSPTSSRRCIAEMDRLRAEAGRADAPFEVIVALAAGRTRTSTPGSRSSGSPA